MVSHTPHYFDADGTLVGWGATVRELDRLSRLFERIIHLAPIYAEPAPASSLPYDSSRIEVRGLAPAGGEGFVDKLGVLTQAPAFFRALHRAYGECDAVHVRAPANVAMLSMVAFSACAPAKPWWFKYAGNWSPSGGHDFRSYRLQRRWLAINRGRGSARRGSGPMVVTVNGRKPGDGEHVHSFMNPCLTRAELETARRSALDKSFDGPLELLFVGRLDGHKGAARALRVIKVLQDRGTEVRLVIAGDGPARAAMERLAAELGIVERVEFKGWLPRRQLDLCYARAHGLLLPSASEGWPKVLSEAMAHGALALTSRVSSIASTLEELGGDESIGWTFEVHDIEGYASVAEGILASEQRFKRRCRRAAEAAEAFSYEAYLEQVRELFRHGLGLNLPAPNTDLGL